MTLQRGAERARRQRGAVVSLRAAGLFLTALLCMGHVGSPDTFFVGEAGPYRVRVSVRLPGVIPGRAQVAVRVVGATRADDYHVAVRAGQWNLGLAGAPPAEAATPVAGDPALYASELWLMTATSYQLFVSVDGPNGHGQAIVPVLALATAQRTMTPGLGAILAALGVFLSVGLLTIVGSAVRESVLPPGVEPDATRRRRARVAMAAAAAVAVLLLWGGNRWWAAEASQYGRSILYRPFASNASVGRRGERPVLTLSIRDPLWTGEPIQASRYNALMPDHGKLMHMFLVREPSLDAFAHVHPVARTPQALDFDADVPPLPPGRYRVYGDIVHESGYAQTLVSTVDIPADDRPSSSDPDDSWYAGPAVPDAAKAIAPLAGGAQLVWQRGERPVTAGEERELSLSVRDEAGTLLDVEPYMGMAAHVAIANADGSVFAHLHPSGSVSMAALQKFAGSAESAHATHHAMPMGEIKMTGDLAIPYAFPRPGSYRMWVQVKRNGVVETAAFDVAVR